MPRVACSLGGALQGLSYVLARPLTLTPGSPLLGVAWSSDVQPPVPFGAKLDMAGNLNLQNVSCQPIAAPVLR